MNELLECVDVDDCVDVACQMDKGFQNMCVNDDIDVDSMFSDSEISLMNDPILDGNYDHMDYPNILDEEIDEDIEEDQDISDEDGELIDMLDGLAF